MAGHEVNEGGLNPKLDSNTEFITDIDFKSKEKGPEKDPMLNDQSLTESEPDRENLEREHHHTLHVEQPEVKLDTTEKLLGRIELPMWLNLIPKKMKWILHLKPNPMINTLEIWTKSNRMWKST